VWVRTKPVDIKITTANHKKLVLVTGQVIETAKNGEAKLNISCVADKTPYVLGAGKKYVIPSTPDSGSGPALDRDKHENAGGNRGPDDFILFPFQFNETEPPKITTLRPETASFRWRSIRKKLVLSLTVIGETKPRWVGQTDGVAGFFSSDELRNNLSELQNKNIGSTLEFIIANPEDNAKNSTQFRLFSLAEERNLQDVLEANTSPLSRAEIYFGQGLYLETAYEYEQILRLFPKKIEILRMAAQAQRLIGDDNKAKEIEDMILKLKKN
jgi:hypothetical protein